MNRLDRNRVDSTLRPQAERLFNIIDAQAQPLAVKFEALIRENENNSWIDAFLRFRSEFEFAPVAATAMDEFRRLQQQHSTPAEKLFSGARELDSSNKTEEANRKYMEIVNKFYASKRYSFAKKRLADRQDK